ncbi:archease [Desulfoferrobacter suflitae]|uniref:archease n=1 Tax=Desulfoferrobacter suflitae TaxID=2865782 RepID=UPI00216411ED|nr:archease [Desulfoferrobacter suflitae]MCK8600959.1 archease [Desulfoferrobacter suflitae]
MPYEYLDEIATADAAFKASGDTLEEMFIAACDATMNVMVGDLETIAHEQQRSISVSSDAIDMLLFELLQELIYYKDAEKLLLRVCRLSISRQDEAFILQADAHGEELNMHKHDLVVDVKAVTLHRFRVEQTPEGWEATVIVDI